MSILTGNKPIVKINNKLKRNNLFGLGFTSLIAACSSFESIGSQGLTGGTNPIEKTDKTEVKSTSQEIPSSIPGINGPTEAEKEQAEQEATKNQEAANTARTDKAIAEKALTDASNAESSARAALAAAQRALDEANPEAEAAARQAVTDAEAALATARENLRKAREARDEATETLREAEAVLTQYGDPVEVFMVDESSNHITVRVNWSKNHKVSDLIFGQIDYGSGVQWASLYHLQSESKTDLVIHLADFSTENDAKNKAGMFSVYWDIQDSLNINSLHLNIVGAAGGDKIGNDIAPTFFKVDGDTDDIDVLFSSSLIDYNAGGIYILWDINQYREKTQAEQNIDLADFTGFDALAILGANPNDKIGKGTIRLANINTIDDKSDLIIEDHADAEGGKGALYIIWNVGDYADKALTIDLGEDAAKPSSGMLTIIGTDGSRLGAGDTGFIFEESKDGNREIVRDFDKRGEYDIMVYDGNYTYVFFGEAIMNARIGITGERADSISTQFSRTILLDNIQERSKHAFANGDNRLFDYDFDKDQKYSAIEIGVGYRTDKKYTDIGKFYDDHFTGAIPQVGYAAIAGGLVNGFSRPDSDPGDRPIINERSQIFSVVAGGIVPQPPRGGQGGQGQGNQGNQGQGGQGNQGNQGQGGQGNQGNQGQGGQNAGELAVFLSGGDGILAFEKPLKANIYWAYKAEDGHDQDFADSDLQLELNTYSSSYFSNAHAFFYNVAAPDQVDLVVAGSGFHSNNRIDSGMVYIYWDVESYKTFDRADALTAMEANHLEIVGKYRYDKIADPLFWQTDSSTNLVVRAEHAAKDYGVIFFIPTPINDNAGAIYILWDVDQYAGSKQTVDLANPAGKDVLTVYGAIADDNIGKYDPDFLNILSSDSYDMVIRSEWVADPAYSWSKLNVGAIYILWDVTSYADSTVSIDLGNPTSASNGLLRIIGKNNQNNGNGLGSDDNNILSVGEDGNQKMIDFNGDNINDIVVQDKDYTYIFFTSHVAEEDSSNNVISKAIELSKVESAFRNSNQAEFFYYNFGGNRVDTVNKDSEQQSGYRFANRDHENIDMVKSDYDLMKQQSGALVEESSNSYWDVA